MVFWGGDRVHERSVHEGVLLRRSALEVLDAKASISSQKGSLYPNESLENMSTMNSDAHISG